MTDRYENIRQALANGPTPGPWELRDGRTDTVENAQGYPVCTVNYHPDERYGHGETKATCLWLKGLPKLTPTNIVEGREARVHRMPPGPDRWKERSRTFEGVAAAMAAQWGQAPNVEVQGREAALAPRSVPLQRPVGRKVE